MANTGQKNDSLFGGQDLLAEALGQSGLDLQDPFDILNEVPGNTLSTSGYNSAYDFLSDLNFTNSLPASTVATQPRVAQPVLSSDFNSEEVKNFLAALTQNSTLPLASEATQASYASSTSVPYAQFPGLVPGTISSQSSSTLQHLLTSESKPLSRTQVATNSPPFVIDLFNRSTENNKFQRPITVPNLSSLQEAGKKELSKRDVSRLWSNDVINLTGQPEKESSDNVDAEDDEEEEELGHTDTYAEYMPCKLSFGRRHPDSVVETSSLASVTPPNIWYKLKLPPEVIDRTFLSALQLEAVVYACQQHEIFLESGERAGFLIGDGAGVGKGRTVAGIIYENYLLGRKRAIWLSVSNDLKYDAIRDLRDIGCHIHVNALNKFKYDVKLSSKSIGGMKKGVIFATYSSLIGESQSNQGKYNTRLKQLLHWCGSDFEGVIILDECHKAKNLVPTGSSKPTKTGLTVLALQNSLPKARVVYCSATGASEPKNMAYMSRLGIWGPGTPFPDFTDFIRAVERRGVGAMEIVAMDMKLRGMYMARQLSFAGVGFNIRDIKLEQKFINMYDKAVLLWNEAREKFEKAADLMMADNRTKKTLWGQFWSAHQRFFKYLCIAAKVHEAVRMAHEAIDLGKCVVIGLQSTGEARTLEQLEEAGGELNDFVSTAKGVLQTLIEKQFPAPGRKRVADILGLDNDSDASDRRSERSSPAPPLTKKRKTKAKKIVKPKKQKSGLELLFNISSGSESDSDGNDDESDDSTKDKGDSNQSMESDDGNDDSADSEEEEEEDFNPFGGSDSDQEDPWAIRKSKKTKVKSKSRSGSPSSQPDPAMSALAAAGLNVNVPNWNRMAATTKPLNGIPSHLKNSSQHSPGSSMFGHSNSFHHSASAPVLSFLLSTSPSPPMTGTAADQCRAMKKELLDKLDTLGPLLPPNTLDELVDSLGGPDKVAEMTGRKGRVVSHEDGRVSYESRSKQDVSLEFLNVEEKKRFMNGEKLVAIISEAASSGISLQADRRAQNQRRRVHITLELPWSADKAIQQFGRTHRSNQVSAPEYVFLISELAGERRFASVVAKRLESLGALTHGDRRATESRDLSRYNFDNKYGRAALETVLKAVLGQAQPMVPPPSSYKGNFFQDVRRALFGVGLVTRDDRGNYSMLDKDYTNMSRFLNRILGMEVVLQNELFSYLMDTFTAVIQQAKRSGRWDEGILDLGSHGEEVNELSVQTFAGVKSSGTATTELHTVSVERGMSWDDAVTLWRETTEPEEGFYLSHQARNDKKMAILVRAASRGKKKKLLSVYRPNTGLQSKQETVEEIKKKYKKVTAPEAQQHWCSQYDSSLSLCSHAYWKGNCKRATLGLWCEVGLRRRSYNILSGSVLSVWSKVEAVLAGQPGNSSKMQIIRCKRSDGKKIVGCLIPSNCVAALSRTLSPQDGGQEEAIEIL
ncbi:protein strawberry notch homolog 1-like [Nematostella vectensis]|uniref:protein strawberry notch homolog 1-like n=1 Tax=Nematostella vectensis TaxID=45351 RepID=UPI0020776DD7|nr:protein strawberry notch homolog 1-like [Nematostella vectensis]